MDFLIYISISDLKNKLLVKWSRFVILGIGVFGIFLDGFLLFLGYIGSELEKLAPIFDNLGILFFIFLTIIGIKDFKNSDIKRHYWTKILLMVFAIGGLIADGFILIKYYELI